MTIEDRDGTSKTIGQLMEGVLGDRLTGANESQRLLALWLMANGERERAHTVGVYLNEAKGKQKLPRLIVYVDSNICVVDFNASRELYLARLEGVGLKLAGVDFKLSRYAAQHRERQQRTENSKSDPLPELTEEERAYIDELVQGVPESLRVSVSKAISSSMRREKAEATKID